MREKLYKCDDCGRKDEFTSYVKARAADSPISKYYKKCYCPNCAPNHRLGAANNANTGGLPQGWEQLKIDNIR